MADNKKEQEREELHRAIWAIADELRGAVDGWDFKNYVLGTMFYRYISENLTNYINRGEQAAGNLDFDYAVIAPTHMLSSMDYRPIIEAHEKSGAQVTAVYKHTSEASKEYLGCDKYKFNADGIITSVKRNIGRTDEADISLSTFIINKRILRKILNDSSKISQLYTIQDMLNFYIDEDTIKVHGYEFSGMVVPILTLEDYVNKSLGLLNYHVRNQLFLPDWPIYTSTHNTPPALYGEKAVVENSFVSNGSRIKGTVINSILSRDVIVEEGAENGR